MYFPRHIPVPTALTPLFDAGGSEPCVERHAVAVPEGTCIPAYTVNSLKNLRMEPRGQSPVVPGTAETSILRTIMNREIPCIFLFYRLRLKVARMRKLGGRVNG